MRSLVFFCTFLLLCACASREVSISGERQSGIIESQKYESTGTEIEVISEGRGFMARKLVRVTLVKEQIVNGFLKLHLGFQSRSNTFQTMQYMVTFFDENGFPLEKATVGWLPISVNPRSVTYQQVLAINKDAQTYKVHVRQLKDADMY